MKGRKSILTSLLALSMAGTTVWALSSPKGGLIESNRIQQRTIPAIAKSKSQATRANDESNLYWTLAQSYYKDGTLDPDNGDERQFGTRIEIDGDKATIYGLIDLYFDEVDKEYAVEGKYDDRAGTITIVGTQYDSDKPVSSFIKLADMYSLTTNEAYTIVLFAGDMYGQQLATIESLVFKVSDDLSTITSQSGFGAYAFSSTGEPMAFYDYYQPGVKMDKSTPDKGLGVSTDNLDFNGLFVAANVSVKQTLLIYNKSSEETTFTISSTSEQIATSISEGKIAACSSRAIEVTLTPNAPGRFEGSLSIISPAISEPIVVNIDIDVCEQPDYLKITKADSAPIEFDMSPTFPFIISEYDGHVAAKSTNNGKGDNTQSYFVCKLDVPKGETGIFSWKAAQLTSQPNTLTIYLDGEPIKYDYYVQTSEPVDMSGIIALSEGKHEVAFSQNITLDWSIYDDISEGYVWDLDFHLIESKENSAYLLEETVDFGITYYDGLSVQITKEVTLLNVGTAPLKVIEVNGNGNFSGEVPSISVPQGGEIAVPLVWTASAIGPDNGEVVITTTAGDFSVKCYGNGEALPYDYSKFVTEGNISFNTDSAWPFKISDNGKYLYNSTSKADIDGITDCWLEAIFEVPEGKVGMISWDAINDSEDIFYFMNTPSLISGTRFNIDGDMEMMVGGQGVNCASSDLFTPEQLTFKSGRHFVRFTYKKTSNSENYIFGDDRLKLFEIALKLDNLENHKGDISKTEIDFENPVILGCAGHYPITLTNYTSDEPLLLSSECDGPFKAKSVNIVDGNLNLMVEFTPENAGDYDNVLTISTNIGDYEISCNGSAIDSGLGKAIFYESFEYDFESNWVFKDANNDDNTWERLSPNVAAFANQQLRPYDGNDGLILKGYDPTIWDYYDTEDFATTPLISIPEDGTTNLQFMVMGNGYMDQYLEILVGEGDDVSSYSLVKTFSFNYPSNWESYRVDLSEFGGKTIHIAFKGYDIAQFIAIDDVLVATTGTVGVSSIENDKKVVSEEYFTTSGLKLNRPINGVNVVVTKYSDGTSTMTKRVIK